VLSIVPSEVPSLFEESEELEDDDLFFLLLELDEVGFPPFGEFSPEGFEEEGLDVVPLFVEDPEDVVLSPSFANKFVD
jgi:hypothetical protein